MAKTYRLEEKVGVGTDLNITDTVGWTVHGSNLSYDEAVTKMKELIIAGSNPIDIRSLRDDGGVELYSYPSEEDKLHLDWST
tara:strand:- start:56 stop:301 length:246 start_codon:yes stop_codon:yes gene_type:complete